MIRSLQQTLILIFTFSAITVNAVSPMGHVSDYISSKCQSFGENANDEKMLNAVLMSRTKMCKASDENEPLVKVVRKAEDQLFDNLAAEQSKTQACQISNLKDFNIELSKNLELEKYLYSKMQLILTEIQALEYKKKLLQLGYLRMKGQCNLAQALTFVNDEMQDLYRNNAVTVNYSCPAKRMSKTEADNIVSMAYVEEAVYRSEIEDADNQLSVLKASIPFSSAPKIQDLCANLREKAVKRAIFDNAKSSIDILAVKDDIQFNANIYNQGFDDVANELKKPAQLREYYSHYLERLQESNQKLRSAKKANNTYALSEDQKKQIMQGPTGQEFILNTMLASKSENFGDAQNMLCRLDARYGKQREKTEAYIDVGLGVATLGLAAFEAVTGVAAPAAPPTAAIAMTRLQAATNFFKNSKIFGYTTLGVSSTTLLVGVSQAIDKCKKPLAQVNECKAYTKENITAELNLKECLASSGMAVAGGLSLGIAAFRKTESGQSLLEKLTGIDFKNKFKMDLYEKNNVKPIDFENIKIEARLGSPEWQAQVNALSNQNIHNLQTATQMVKVILENPVYRALAKEVFQSGSFEGLKALSAAQQSEFILGLNKYVTANVGLTELKLKKATLTAVESAAATAELEKFRGVETILRPIVDSHINTEVAQRLTNTARSAVETVERFEKAAKGYTSGNNILKDK